MTTPRITLRSRGDRPLVINLWASAFMAGLASLAASLMVMRITPDDLQVPFGQGDAPFYYGLTNTMIRFGWFTWNPDVGYPYGLDQAHFPAPEIRMYALLKLLTLVTSDPILALNAFFLIGFVAVGACSYLLFFATTRLQVVSFILAVSIATLPWHFARFRHPMLADYSAVPIGLLLAFLMWKRWWAQSLARLSLALAAAVYIGAGGAYYAFYAMLAIGPVLVWRLGSSRSLRACARDFLVTSTIPVTLALALAAHHALVRTPGDGASVTRDPWESAVYAGDFLGLFIPWPFSSGLLTSGRWEGDPRYNLLGALAVVVSIGALGVLVAASRRPHWRGRRMRLGIELAPWFGLLVWMILWFVPGMGVLFAYAVSPNLRSWGRVSVVIVYIATVIFGICLRAWSRSDGLRSATMAAVLVAILAWQLAQDHSPWLAPWAREFDQQGHEYARVLSRKLPSGCPVLQIPIVEYPEGFPAPTDRMGVYDHNWPQIYAPDLKWSFGVMRGTRAARKAEQKYSPDLAAATVVSRAREDRYCAIHIDVNGMTPSQNAAFERALGDPTAEVGRWRLYVLDANEARREP